MASKANRIRAVGMAIIAALLSCAGVPRAKDLAPMAGEGIAAAVAESRRLIADLDFDGALSVARSAVEAASNDLSAWRQLALALGFAGKVDEALEAYDRALAISPGNPRVLNARAMLLDKIGRAAEAVEDTRAALASALARKEASLRGAILDTEAWSLFFAGDLAGARSDMKAAIAANPAVEPYSRLLEFRLLLAEKGRDAAFAYAAKALPDMAPAAAQLLRVMIGEKDIRDISYDSSFMVSDYALFLSGFSISPEAPDVPAGPASAEPGAVQAPVVLVSDPSSIGADQASAAIAKIAYRDGLAGTGAFVVVDADSRKSAVEELELTLSGATAARRDSAIGGLFAADFVASGSVIRSDAGWFVAFTLSDAVTGRILASDFSIAHRHEAIIGLAEAFAKKLADMLRTGKLPSSR